MHGDNFMWFPEKSGSKIIGETTDEVFSKKKAFELKSFNFAMTSEEATEGKGGANSSAGKAKFGAFSISKSIDSASTALYKACSQGTIFPSIMVGVRQPGGYPLLYLQYIFRYNQITGITWSGGSGEERATEDITISFKAMALQYIPQKPDGSEGTAQQWTWNTTDQGTPSLDIKGIEPAPSFLTGSGNG